jgi:hypothetical protein
MPMPLTRHVLPDEADGDTRWFYRQNRFEREEIVRQVEWKRARFPSLPDGLHVKYEEHSYPHILPSDLPTADDNRRRAFWPEMADSLFVNAGRKVRC